MISDISKYSEFYNSLPSLDEATNAVNPDVFDVMMSELKSLFSSDFRKLNLGVSLLHRHHPIQMGELMIENKRGDVTELYITRPETLFSLENIVPSIWKCHPDGNILAFEFSQNGLSNLTRGWFAESKPLFSEFGHIVSKHGLEDVIGMCSIHHGDISLDAENFVAVEETIPIDRAHHVSIRQRSLPPGGFGLPTAWNFAAKKSRTCIPYRECVERSPGHSIVRGHEYVDPC